MFWLLPSTMKLGQCYIFIGVCDSVHRGGLPQSMLRYHHHPPEQIPPGADTQPPGSRHPPENRHPPRADTRLGADHPWEQTPPGPGPPGTEHAGRYGQRVGSTHPTGMQSL